MKVIKRGFHPEMKTYQVECNSCNSTIEFEKHEASHSPDPRELGVLYVQCPVCSRSIGFNA